MAGMGPPPKAPGKKAGHSKDTTVMRILPAILADQPDLPEFNVVTESTDVLTGDIIKTSEPFVWPEITRGWWQMWADSPLAADFTSTDWSELRDTALLHAQYWSGKLSLASELRLRTAKFGATPEDRLRLRITFAQAVEAETKTVKAVSSRDRFANMRVANELES